MDVLVRHGYYFDNSTARIAGQANVNAGYTAIDNDTGNLFLRTPTGWVPQDGVELTLVKYAGSGFTYVAEAVMGTARSTAAWRVMRITDASGDIVYAGAVGSTAGTFAFAATDLATVAALTYTLGA